MVQFSKGGEQLKIKRTMIIWQDIASLTIEKKGRSTTEVFDRHPKFLFSRNVST